MRGGGGQPVELRQMLRALEHQSVADQGASELARLVRDTRRVKPDEGGD